VPFHHQGRHPSAGLDCIGLVVQVAKDLGIPYGDLEGYPREPDGVSIYREFSKHFDTINLDEWTYGDVLVFWITDPARPQHCGIVCEHAHLEYGMIHTHAGIGKVTEHVLNETWLKRLSRAFRYPGIV